MEHYGQHMLAHEAFAPVFGAIFFSPLSPILEALTGNFWVWAVRPMTWYDGVYARYSRTPAASCFIKEKKVCLTPEPGSGQDLVMNGWQDHHGSLCTDPVWRLSEASLSWLTGSVQDGLPGFSAISIANSRS